MRKTFLLLLSFSALFNCIAQTSVHKVSPISADQQVFSFVDPNYAFFNTTSRERNRLVVTLGAKGYHPENFQRFDSFAASLGYHVIGLSYNNSPSICRRCKESDNEDCFYQSRKQVLTGEALTQDIQVDTSHSIVLRLRNMLNYLDANFQDEGWGQFLSPSNKVNWNMVLVAGHSEGANMAAFMGKMLPVERVLCFSPIPEISTKFNRAAKWLSMDGELRESEYYTFYQEEDTVATDSTFFSALSLYDHDAPLYVEDRNYPYDFSRNLRTRFISDYDHEITLVDERTPIEKDGTEKFKSVWGYMLTNDVVTSVDEWTSKIEVYPNPFTERVSISTPNETRLSWFLRDVFGKVLLKGSGNEVIAENLPSGMYYLDIKYGELFVHKKLVKY